MRRPAPARLPSAIEVSVDLPMPGRAAEQHERAGHEPAAEHAVELADAGVQPGDLDRLDVGEADGAGGGAPAPRAARRRARRRGRARCSSASVFHSPQPGQRPCHLGSSWPQAEQVKTVVGRAMGVGR